VVRYRLGNLRRAEGPIREVRLILFSYDIQTAIDIDADADAIWQALIDFGCYKDWNPMLRNVRTDLALGAKVRFEVLREGKSSLKLRAKIVRLNEAGELAWRGGSSGILSGEHYFKIEPIGEGRCRFQHGERFRGPLLPLVRRVLKDAPPLYIAMNEALKSRVEHQE
jgi:hypothetical protein